MKVIATYPKKRPEPLQYAFWGYAALVLLVTLYELFKFEELPLYIVSRMPFILAPEVFAALLVSIQVFSLPYLLGMKLSRLMYYVSALCVVLSSILMLIFLSSLSFT